MDDRELRRRALIGGVALTVCGVALAAVTVAEFGPGEARGDGDNPADGVRFLAEHGAAYSGSGLGLVVGAAALVAGALAVRSVFFARRRSFAYEVASTFGVLAAGLLAGAGVMRLQAVGTVPYIAAMDASWGESAYLAVQLAGTQGLLSAGIVALAAWLIATALGLWRRGVRWPIVFAAFPLFIVVLLALDLGIPVLEIPDSLFVVYAGVIAFGLPIAAIGDGIALLVPGVRARLLRPA